jgi:hypothetical protein
MAREITVVANGRTQSRNYAPQLLTEGLLPEARKVFERDAGSDTVDRKIGLPNNPSSAISATD